MDTFSGLELAGRAMVRAAEASPTTLRPTWPTVSCTSTRPVRTVSTTAFGERAISLTAPATSSTDDGSRRGRQLSGGTSRGSGLASRMTCPMSTAAAPSTIAWWVLVRIAKRSSSRPSTRYISHSGRARSSGRLMIRATRSWSWSSVPGRGSAERRTW